MLKMDPKKTLNEICTLFQITNRLMNNGDQKALTLIDGRDGAKGLFYAQRITRLLGIVLC